MFANNFNNNMLCNRYQRFSISHFGLRYPNVKPLRIVDPPASPSEAEIKAKVDDLGLRPLYYESKQDSFYSSNSDLGKAWYYLELTNHYWVDGVELVEGNLWRQRKGLMKVN